MIVCYNLLLQICTCAISPHSPCQVKAASNSSFWLISLQRCAMSLYSHTQNNSQDRHYNLGSLRLPKSWSRKYSSTSLKRVSRNSADHWINILLGNSSHKKRRSSSAINVALFCLVFLRCQLQSIQSRSLAFSLGKKVIKMFHIQGNFKSTIVTFIPNFSQQTDINNT